MSGGEAQRLIALSLGKIAMSRQQRGGINLHKNLLVASVLHKARTTYMMDNFQTLIANRKVQAEREAAAKMVVDSPTTENKDIDTTSSQESSMDDQVVPSRGVTDSENRVNECGAPNGERPDCRLGDKENSSPRTVIDSTANPINLECTETVNNVQSNKRACISDTPLVTGKQPLSEHNENIDQESVQLSTCRCSGGKRKRSCVDSSDSLTQNKRLRVVDAYDSCESDTESEVDPTETKDYESMHTETTQVTNLVDIFNSGFSGLYKDNTDQSSDNSSNGHTGQINVYVSADRPLSGSQFVLKDMSCATQIKDNVTIPTAIALAV